MPSPFQANGAQLAPSKSASLYTNRFFKGLWTQRSPLRDAATPFLYEKGYGATRYDSFLGGVNTEITTRLTLARRPGHSVWAQGWAGGTCRIARYANFRPYVNGAEQVYVVFDATGPLGINRAGTSFPLYFGGVGYLTPAGPVLLYEKGHNGPATFAAVGNQLFFAVEDSFKKWTLPAKTWAASTLLAAGATIMDPNLNIQVVTVAGATGGAQPNWPVTPGATVTDGQVTWTCKGFSVTSVGLKAPVAAPNTAVAAQAGAPGASASWTYAYAYRNSVTGHVSTASPLSGTQQPGTGQAVTVSGSDYALASPMAPAGADVGANWDTIRVYRTTQGGATLFLLADVPRTSPDGQIFNWSYTDANTDAALNIFIQAQIARTNDPPPQGLSAPAYWTGRLWGFVGNVLNYSGGPSTLSGSGLEAWPPANYFTLPSQGLRLWPTAVGLLVYTTSDVYIVQGSGTASSPFTCTMFQEGVGLLGYDLFAVNGSTAFLVTTARRLIAFDPGAGETEVGFPVGDTLATYLSAGGMLAYHEGSSADTALYVSDAATGWYRLSTIAAPESGQAWSPQAVLAGGVSAIASVEVAPGQKRLLAASGTTTLMRDLSVWADNGTAYPATAVIGSIVLAQPGEIAGVEFITCDTTAAGSRPQIGLLFGEISGTFAFLSPTRQDPTLLPPSTTIRGDRYYMPQVGRPAWCRHLQLQVAWPAEAAANELLTYTLYGDIKQEVEG